MADRYFVDTFIAGDQAVLTGSEAHHLLHVMRAKPGIEVVLFDGSGVEFTARVEGVTRSTVELAVLSRVPVDRELPAPLIVGVALPKGDRQKWLVEKLTELGATRLVPLETQRGVAQPVAGTLERLRRGVIEASKQCGRNRLMEIAEPQRIGDFLTIVDEHVTRYFAHPGGTAVDKFSRDLGNSAAVAVGPEGGFTEAEHAAAVSAGWQPVDLGVRILRVETAAALMTVLASLALVNR